MEARFIAASRRRLLLAFLILLAVAVGGAALALSRRDPFIWPLWFGATVCGGWSLIFLRALFRPPRLVLGESAFTLEGAWLVPTKTVPWRDISEFFVWDFQGRWSLGWRLQPHVTVGPMTTVNGQAGRFDRTVNRWALGPDELVPVLNGYLKRATTRARPESVLTH